MVRYLLVVEPLVVEHPCFFPGQDGSKMDVDGNHTEAGEGGVHGSWMTSLMLPPDEASSWMIGDVPQKK